MLHAIINIARSLQISGRNESSVRLWPATAAITVYCLLYEWVGILDFPHLRPAVNTLKVILPVLLLFYLRDICKPNKEFRKYCYFFLLFMVWSLIPNLLSGEIAETMRQWCKYVPRLLFCYIVGYYVMQSSEHICQILKVFVIIAIIALIQYVFLEYSFMTGGEYTDIQSHRGGRYYGPFGLFGQGLGNIWFPSYELQIFRLYGFWLEPSTSSGFMFMSYFMAQALYLNYRNSIWKVFSVLCVIAGLCTFSNAGYFSFGCSLLVGQSIDYLYKRRARPLLIFFITLSVFFISYGLFGRYFSLSVLPKFCNSPAVNEYFQACSGANRLDLKEYETSEVDTSEEDLTEVFIESTSGRLGVIKTNIKMLQDSNWLGIGFRIPGINSSGKGITVSGTAPVYWLLFAGVPGLLFLLFREYQVLRAVIDHFPPDLFSSRILQGLSVIFFQNMLYGTWMTPLYFVLVAILFASLKDNNDPVASGMKDE